MYIFGDFRGLCVYDTLTTFDVVVDHLNLFSFGIIYVMCCLGANVTGKY